MILTICHFWIAGLWLVFLVYWAVAAMRMKGTIGRTINREGMAFRLILFLVIVVLFSLAKHSPELRTLQWAVLHSVPMALIGAAIATAGAIFAFAARAVIGRNWGTPGTRRTDTELVTTGPYRLVRHPIYSGILLMMIGSAIGLLPIWWFVVAVAGIYFLYSARREEGYMAERFPDEYPAYRARTKMLIPFLL